MDLRKTLHIHRPGKHKKGETTQLAAQLAPLEEQHPRAAEKQLAGAAVLTQVKDELGFSAIVVDKDSLQVPQEIMEGSYEKTYLGMEPVVIVILAIMLSFIAFIAWQITLMPVE